MITIIAGTNRDKNKSILVANYYSTILTSKGIENQIFHLADLPTDFIFSGLYGKDNAEFASLLKKYILDVNKLIIISPEYNGSFPGVLKAFIDGWDPKNTPGKWAALVGVAAGRQGNSRGMDDLTNVLHYLQINVIPVKIPVSQIWRHFDKEGNIAFDEEFEQLFDKQSSLLNEV